MQHRECLAGDHQAEKIFKESKWVWSSNGNVTHNGLLAERRRCLGVLACSSCARITRPKTRGLAGQVGTLCIMPKCEGSLQHRSCDALCFHSKDVRDGQVYLLWDHVGTHNHPKPPGGNLTGQERIQVQQQVYRNQKGTAHQLRTGDTGPGSVPLPDISQKLADSQSARYHVEQAKNALGITPASPSKSSAGALHSWKDLQTKLDEEFIIDSRLHGSVVVFVLQTSFMRKMLQTSVDLWLHDSESMHAEASRHGCITDGDHSFFRSANLLATCVFNPDIAAWVPVLYSYLDALDTDHHRPHFKHLFHQIADYAGDKFNKEMLTHVRFFLMRRV